MKIYIKADGVRLSLWFPLSMLKSRIGYKVIEHSIAENTKRQLTKSAEQEQLRSQIDEKQSSLTHEQVVEMYRILRQCVKQHGHFNIFEVESADGEKVIIRV